MRYNAYLSYRVRDKSLGWLDGTRIRLGVINLMDKEPPLAADSRGYTTNLYGVMARGRSWSLEITKQL
jgi:outer membrane receptor protein involved in Fe transport